MEGPRGKGGQRRRPIPHTFLNGRLGVRGVDEEGGVEAHLEFPQWMAREAVNGWVQPQGAP